MSSSVFRFNPDSNGFQTEKSVPYFSVSAETLFKHPGIKTEKKSPVFEIPIFIFWFFAEILKKLNQSGAKMDIRNFETKYCAVAQAC